MREIAIIGGGPAGVTAAIYSARAGFAPVIFEKLFVGGQIASASIVENYPATGSMSGFELAQKFAASLSDFDNQIINAEVISLSVLDGKKVIKTADGEHQFKAVIICTGAVPKKLGVPGEDLSAVSYCATCDGAFYKNKTVAVIGGGNTAVSDAVFLSSFCEKVYIIHRRDEFRADKVSVFEMLRIPNIEPIYNTVPKSFNGFPKVSSITLDNGDSIQVDGVFVAVGVTPVTGFLNNLGLNLDNLGAIITDNQMQTNIDGVFAAGDARSVSLRQIVTACADGAISASAACSYLKKFPL